MSEFKHHQREGESEPQQQQQSTTPVSVSSTSSTTVGMVGNSPAAAVVNETRLTHFKSIVFMFKCALKLKIGSIPLSTSCTIYHRFFRRNSTSDFDPFLIAATCLYLGCKVEEEHVKMRDLINVTHNTLYPDQSVLTIGGEYHAYRDSIVSSELYIIRVLNFRVICDHPHKYLLQYLKSLKDWFSSEEWNQSAALTAAETSWILLRDSYCSNICLRYKPQHIAIALLYFAFYAHNVQVPCNDDAQIKWYEVFHPDITATMIEQIITEQMSLYTIYEKKI